MSDKTDDFKIFLDTCSNEDKQEIRKQIHLKAPHGLEKEWDVDADTILSAIERSSDLTKRGVRGIIAEAVFDREVLPTIKNSGWTSEKIVGDLAFDALLRSGEKTARIQIKLQRLEKSAPKIFYAKHYGQAFYVVEVQKTRSGERVVSTEVAGTGETLKTTKQKTVDTRPYKFDDFDILAVNMHPSCKNWKEFRFTLARWLLPRDKNKDLIEIMQPVAAGANEAWTDNLEECLNWLISSDQRSVLPEPQHKRLIPKKKRKGTKKKLTKKTT